MAFLEAYRAADYRLWPAEDTVAVIRWALEVGAYQAAGQLAAVAAVRHPDSAELQRYARVLAPRERAQRVAGTDTSTRADTAWFAQHSAEYRGQWVAVKNGKLLGAAETLQGLERQVPDLRSATVTKVNW